MPRIPSDRNLVPLNDDGLLISMGVYPGITVINKFGTNPAVGMTEVDIWQFGGKITHMTVASTLEIASSDANDTLAGTGAQQLHIEGYDANYVAITEVVNMNGQTPVVTANVYLGLERAHIETGGSTQSNEGVIYIADDSTAWTAGVPQTAAAVQATIAINKGQTQQAFYTIPADTTAYLTTIYVSSVSGKTVTFTLAGHHRTEQTFRIKMEGNVPPEAAEFMHAWHPYLQIPEKVTLHLRAKVSATTSQVSAGFDMILVRNNAL